MRIGIQGGTFNPVHFGHLRAAEEVREALALDQVRFIPSAEPPHKQPGEIAPAADRLEMVRLAVADNPAFLCDPSEVERGGRSYTLDTLEALAAGPCRGQEMHFIVGADAFSEVATWHAPVRVLRAANFAVTLRGGQSAEKVIESLKDTLKPVDRDVNFMKIHENAYQLADSKYLIRFVEISTLDISATVIRKMARARVSFRYLLPREVELFIIRRQLYGVDPPPRAGAPERG